MGHKHIRPNSLEGTVCIKPQTGSDFSASVMISEPFGDSSCEIFSYLKPAVGTS